MNKSLTYSNIWKITFPVMLSLLAMNFINLTDTIFLGWVGEVELGASAIGGLFYYGVFVVGFGFSIGTQIIISRRNGERNYTDIGRVFDQSMYFLLFLGAVITLLVQLFAHPLLNSALASKAVADATWQYLDIRIWGIFFAFIGAVFRAFYIGILRPAVLSWAAGLTAVLNILLAWMMIFGKGGMPAMGIAGAALASVISEAAGAMLLVLFSLPAGYRRNFGLFRFARPHWHIIGQTLSVSVYTMLQNFMAMGGWLTFFVIIEQAGERPLAISNIIRSIYIILMIPLWAFGTTTNSMVSNLMGEGRADLVLKAIRRITLMSLAATSAVVLIAALLPGPILSLYTSDPSLVAESKPVYFLVMAALVMFSIVIPVYSGVTGTGNTLAGMLIEAVTIFTYLCFVYLVVVVLQRPILIAWYSEFVYFLVMGSLSFAYLRLGKWQKIKI